MIAISNARQIIRLSLQTFNLFVKTFIFTNKKPFRFQLHFGFHFYFGDGHSLPQIAANAKQVRRSTKASLPTQIRTFFVASFEKNNFKNE